MNQEQLALSKEIKYKVALGESLRNLERNPDFQFLLDDYLKNYAISLTHALGGIDLDGSIQHNVTKRLTSIALFKQYLDDVKTAAVEAQLEKQYQNPTE